MNLNNNIQLAWNYKCKINVKLLKIIKAKFKTIVVRDFPIKGERYVSILKYKTVVENSSKKNVKL